MRITNPASGGSAITLPGSSTDNALVRWDGTGGDTLQDSGVTVDASDNMSGVTTLNGLTLTTDASRNTASGSAAFASLTSGTDNTGVGYQALTATFSGSHNTALGSYALLSNGNDSYTTGVGSSAGRYSSGTDCTFIGSHSGYPDADFTRAAETADRVTMVGSDTGFSDTGQYSDVVALGYGVDIGGSYAISIGSGTSATAAGAVAIGVDSGGTGASTSTANEIRLGTANHTVNVPGAVITAASTTAKAGFRIGDAGTAPTAPVNGDMWIESDTLKIRLGGATYTVTVS